MGVFPGVAVFPFRQIRPRRPRARRCTPEINLIPVPHFVEQAAIRLVCEYSLCCPLVIGLFPKGEELNETTVPHVVMGFRTRSDLVGVVVNVRHTDTIVKRLIPVQP